MIRSGNLRVSAAREISRGRKATEGSVGPLCICAVCIVCAFCSVDLYLAPVPVFCTILPALEKRGHLTH